MRREWFTSFPEFVEEAAEQGRYAGAMQRTVVTLLAVVVALLLG